jgi:hypothetical protein
LKEKEEKDRKKPKNVNFFWDYKELWASFYGAYKIDLYQVGDLHWWGFVGLTGGLGPESSIGRLMHVRAEGQEKKAKKTQRLNAYLAAIPNQEDVEEE